MRLGILVTSTPEHLPLARITVPNRLEYCARHGYSFFLDVAPFVDPERIVAMQKFLGQVDWLWYQGTDLLITDQRKRAEDLIRPGTDFLIGEDRFGINSDSMLFRDCGSCHALLAILKNWRRDGYKDEQACLAELLGGSGHDWRVTKVIERVQGLRAVIAPQREFNAYPDYDYYAIHSGGNPNDPGRWQKGDFVAHFPGMPMERKIQRCVGFLSEVVR